MKISITGPESTGKTTLANALAAHFGGAAVAEYARGYVENLGRPYNYDDVCAIAGKQIEEIEFYEKSKDFAHVFFDTDLIITKVWFEYCYSKVPEFLLDAMKLKNYDLYLLCSPDIAWIPDPVRENGNIRDYLFERYRTEIEKTNTPYAIIKGTGIERTKLANSIISKFSRLLI